MNYNRRKFIKISGGAAAGVAVSSMAGMSLLSCAEKAKASEPFGIQLYTLRDILPADPKGILKQVASFGYKFIESYEGPNGMFWGMSNKDFKKYMDDLGMVIVSSHTDINKDFDRKAAEAAEIGIKYLICPYLGAQPSLDHYKKFAADFNNRGEICKKNGIRFAYHNHEYTFVLQEGQYPQDVLMTNTDPALVDYEMDIFWVVTGKQDPVTWLKKYPNRFKLSHVKDRKKNTDERDAMCELGTGIIDFPTVLRVAKENGMEYFITEQDTNFASSPMKSVEQNAAYMKNIKF
ncbi:MAG TPA: TIM barrel protein [Chitinophagaceae bacterium]